MEEEKESLGSSIKNWVILGVIIVGILGIAYWWGYAHDTNRPWWKGEQTVLQINRGLTSTVQAFSNGSQITQVGDEPVSNMACDVQNSTRECSVAYPSGVIVILQPIGGGGL